MLPRDFALSAEVANSGLPPWWKARGYICCTHAFKILLERGDRRMSGRRYEQL